LQQLLNFDKLVVRTKLDINVLFLDRVTRRMSDVENDLMYCVFYCMPFVTVYTVKSVIKVLVLAYPSEASELAR